MSTEPQRIAFTEFEARLTQIFDRLGEHNEPVLVERNGQTYRLERDQEDIWKDYDPEKVQQALTASQGLFAGTDRATFLREMHEQREQGANRTD